MKLLLIEDNLELAHWLVQLLREQAFVVDHVADGAAADQLLRQGRYDVVLLDLNLPLLSGKGVLRRIRERQDAVAVIVLTATASLDQKVQCLEIGADDYLVKPIEVRELVARIQALMRRQMPGRANLLSCGDLHYDLRTRQFECAGVELALPPRERTLLETLMRHTGEAVSRQALVQSLFGVDEDASADAIDLYVHRLRKKLEASRATIVTLRGVGWLLRARST
ncbi:MAG: DNA-binding response regulator [Comamonas sp. SCN 67-35]|uniref:response regulator transcription factor n=1 Tax=unclassified Comamonas TaxID=2638500 RepID=UPI00086BEEAD|nr:MULTISPECIES: response regulator transcription factor [unclassified Comamonas]MBN9331175.1 response regulator transcription factor [Comamonas sp.]ODU37709.1 MAG: DNA-binding response regulator [Comamonas sp. SCN 67-35]OJX02888.1 MAG: DNA-binding response regulator [Burkholderiales bacterium 66-26]